MKKFISIILSILLIASLMMCGAVSTSAASYNEGDLVVYEYVVKCDKIIEAFEGEINYPADDLSVESDEYISIYDNTTGSIVAHDDGQGKILFNASSSDDVYDFTQGVTLAMVAFTVKNPNFDPADIKVSFNNFYDSQRYEGGNIPFSFESYVDDEPIVIGNVDLDNPNESETTEVPTQAPTTTEPNETVAPTEATPDEPTEAPTQEVTEAPTTAPATEVTEAPTTAAPTDEPTEAPTTVAPTEAPTLPAEGTFHVVAGDAGLCNGVNWDPTSAFNLMTLGEDGVYSIVYENVPAGQYNFKVTTNGAWDIADFNLTGDAKFGGPNAVIEVTEDGSWVTITFKESDMHANAYINDVLVDVCATEPATKPETEPATTEPATEATTQAPTVCNHSATKTTTTAATYFAKGKTVVTCAACGKVLKTTSIAKKVLKTPTVTVKAAKKSIKVTYKKKIKNATGFEVKYQIKGKKKVYTKTYKSNKKATKVIRKLKSDKKYTVKVRAYIKSGKKIAYSKWTKAKTVKVK
ncbi:MAG: hypothetical protein ACI4HO_04225 [Ruminococcus sp.]